MIDFNLTLFGEESLGTWLAYIFMFLIGVALRYLISTTTRKHPYEELDLGYFIYDNWKKFLAIIIVMWISIRFYLDIEEYIRTRLGFNVLLSKGFIVIALGFLSQLVLLWLSKKYNILKSKLSPTEYKTLKKDKK